MIIIPILQMRKVCTEELSDLLRIRKFESIIKQNNQIKFSYKSQTLNCLLHCGINAMLRSEVNTVSGTFLCLMYAFTCKSFKIQVVWDGGIFSQYWHFSFWNTQVEKWVGMILNNTPHQVMGLVEDFQGQKGELKWVSCLIYSMHSAS